MNNFGKYFTHAWTHGEDSIRAAGFSVCCPLQPLLSKQAINPRPCNKGRGVFIAPDVCSLSGDTKLRLGTDSLEKSDVLAVLRQRVRARYKDMLARGYYVADRSRRLADQALSLAAQRGRLCLGSVQNSERSFSLSPSIQKV